MKDDWRPGCAALVGAACLVARMAHAAGTTSLETVPFPPGSALEPAVAAQLSGVESNLARLLAAPATSPVNLAEAFGEVGQFFHAYEFWNSASVAYRNAETLSPGDYRWVHLRADVEFRRGDVSLARGLHERALTLRPGDVPSLVGLGESCLSLNRLDEADRAFTAALRLAPESAAAFAGRARVALVRRDFASARDGFATALRLAPDATRLHYEMAMAERGLGNRVEAARHLAASGTVGVKVADPLLEEVSARRTGERAHLVRGRLAFVNGRWREAAEEFGAAVATEPRSVAGLVGLGSALGMLGDSDRALDAFARAVALDPGNVAAHYNAGRLLADRGDADAALKEFDTVLRLAPQDADARRARAALLDRGVRRAPDR